MSDRRSEIDKAKSLITAGVSRQSGIWADLGSGDGVYTAALVELLEPGSSIYAVDQSREALQSLEGRFHREYVDFNNLITMQADFRADLDLPGLDGIMMANSLHFVEDKESALSNIIKLLKPNGCLIVVEYNTKRGNRWVPYPIGEKEFLELTQALGMQQGRILNKIPSSFLGEFYAGMAVIGNGSAYQ
ncbi:MAG: class I SAM-dependent methyltransferase [Chloroflexi bacterium]|nr:MAG: class I SAM-dependent methyltransferase [Chloroflexota bacterium]MBL1194658.1 class I SAM-dependent methyltransferase [Chloroflexota bacterium]NOH11948.1 class I SAM-dependent methyltransferase [Chloroflexota bacterium]